MLAVVQPRATLAHAFPKQGVGVEIGVFKGDFSDLTLRVAQPKTLHLIDPWISSVVAEHRGALYSQEQRSQKDMDEIFANVKSRFASQIESRRVIIHRQPSAVAMELFADELLDFVYIDGDHSERAVAVDLDLAFRKVKSGGLISGDDYHTRAWWRGGVIRATNWFIGEHFDRLSIVFAGDAQFMLRKTEPMH